MSKMSIKLTEQQRERYSRHIVLEGFGRSAQEKLLSSKVLVVGVGGLGSPVSLYLAAAGVATLGIIDPDTVDLANLPRQVIHHTKDIGTAKVQSAAAKIGAMNPDVTVKTYQRMARADNIRGIVRQYDFVIDASDNFATKFLINDACYFERVAFSHAGVLRYGGQIMTVIPGQSACCRCLLESPPPRESVPTGREVGIMCTVPGAVGLLQVTEAIKYLVGAGCLLTDTIMVYDALEMDFRKLKFNRSPDCPLCGDNPRITDVYDDG